MLVRINPIYQRYVNSSLYVRVGTKRELEMIFLAQMPAAPKMPPLPEGPSLDRVRGPIEIPAYEPWQIILALGFIVLLLAY